jgi:hypothetical protein
MWQVRDILGIRNNMINLEISFGLTLEEIDLYGNQDRE